MICAHSCSRLRRYRVAPAAQQCHDLHRNNGPPQRMHIWAARAETSNLPIRIFCVVWCVPHVACGTAGCGPLRFGCARARGKPAQSSPRAFARAPTRPAVHRHHRPHLHRDWAHPCHICTGTGLTPVHICTGTGARPCHICAGTGPAPATSATGLGSPLPHLQRA